MGKITKDLLYLVIGSMIVWGIVIWVFYEPELANEEPLLDIEEIFGSGATLEIDTSFTATDMVLSKEIVYLDGVEVGLLYEVEDTSIYNGSQEGKLNFIFVLGNDLEILGYIEVVYEHSRGNFRANAINFLDNLKGTYLNEFEDLDASTGATNTTNLLTEMMLALKAVVENN